jgi:hypothetical protein
MQQVFSTMKEMAEFQEGVDQRILKGSSEDDSRNADCQ